MLCQLCETRKPRRYCPGIRAEICPLCCGKEREETVNCPLDCEYLREARKHEVPPIADPAGFPNNDIRVTEEFLRTHEHVLLWIAMHLLNAARETEVLDNDVKEAFSSLVATYRTLQSGLVYESRPANPLAANLQARVQEAVAEYRRRASEAGAGEHLRDAEVLGILAFLQRLEIQRNNGRRRGRAFIDFLREHFPQQPEPDEEKAPLIVP